MANDKQEPAMRPLTAAERQLWDRIQVKAAELDQILGEILQVKGQAPAGALAMIAKNVGFAKKYLGQATQHALQAVANVKE